MSKGIDVSSYQGVIDWNKVAGSGVTFAFVKATEGLDWKDPNFITNFKQAKDAGIEVGAYHFGHPGNDPVAEATHFVSVMKEVGSFGDLPLTLDVEVTDGKNASEVTAWAVQFLNALHNQTNHPVQYYTYTGFLQKYLDLSQLQPYPLWIANYSSTAGVEGYTYWQYSDAGTVAGISGKVDMNVTGNGGTVIMATILQVGDSGNAVRTLQEDLNKAGANLVTDGQFGPSTESAVKAFQTKYHLTVDGIVGPMTEQKLQDVIKPPAVEVKPPAPVAPKPVAVAPVSPPVVTSPAPPAKQPIDKAHLAAIILMILGAAKPILQANGITFPNVDLNQVSNLIATIAISAGAIWASIRHNSPSK